MVLPERLKSRGQADESWRMIGMRQATLFFIFVSSLTGDLIVQTYSDYWYTTART